MSWRAGGVAIVLAVVASAGCSSDDPAEPTEEATDTSTTTVTRPDGPVAEIDGPLTAGKGIDLVSTISHDLAAAGWTEEEFTAAGTASSYRAVGALPADGTFELEPDQSADFRTRVVVRRPAAAADFNGTVVVEWLNVSAGLDAAPDWGYLGDELLRGGYAWVGVSAQHIGVEGGPALVAVDGAPSGGLKGGDPERYGDLTHPGDAFAFDIFTQVARALRDPGAVDPLAGLTVGRVLAVGESQSGFALTTYVNGVQPLTRAFDGFLVHSRGRGAMPLGEPGAGISLAGAIASEAVRIRTDGDAPVLVLETETDVVGVLGYHAARQPDGDRFRLWEVAGTAHADAFLIGPLADVLDCGGPINAGPHHFVAKAALRHLDAWVRTGSPPPQAERIEVDDGAGGATVRRDGDGLALGGIRTPQVDVPVAALSGDPWGAASPICILMGSTRAFSPDQLERYASPDAYLAAYETAASKAIKAGFVLEEDRAALLADAQPDLIGG